MILLMALPAMASNGSKVIFEMEDPTGDSHGPGNYTYASSEEFGDRISEMLDLTYFKVTDLGKNIEFRLTFALEPNYVSPWEYGEFNFHRIDIYLVSEEGNGKTESFNKGAMVQFDTPWDKLIKIADFNQSKIYHSDNDAHNPNQGIGQSEEFTIEVENKDIVVTVDKGLIGVVDNTTMYYVLVGHQDGYGLDDYRPVAEERGRYVGGGGSDDESNPNIYDILAETTEEQYKQLKWKEGELATLKPVGGVPSKFSFKVIIIAALAIVVVMVLVAALKRRR